MLLTKFIMAKWTNSNRKNYESKGYIFTKQWDEFEVKVEDLSDGSHAKVEVKCDNPNCENPYLKPWIWKDYKVQVKDDGKCYCGKCSNKLFGTYKRRKTDLSKGESFKKWCIEHNRQDILGRWDYEKNEDTPDNICCSINNKYWFKCPRGIHESELKNINNFTCGHDGSINCKKCNSFAQWGIDNIGEDFLEKYWDYEKNNKLGITPWEVQKGSNKPKVFTICQEKGYHDSYDIRCNDFVNGDRCPYCSNKNGKFHILDSLGTFLENKNLLNLWSDKNTRSPYTFTPMNSTDEVWWECPEGKHEDYYRLISSSNIYDFRCPFCQFSKGEKRIEDWLIKNNFIENVDYKPQKEFDGLIGLGNGNLSYDFCVFKYGLIEYQGEQHEHYIEGFHKSIKDFEKQVEHDKRKKEYADKNNIKLLPIWYWNFDNIKEILDKEILY